MAALENRLGVDYIFPGQAAPFLGAFTFLPGDFPEAREILGQADEVMGFSVTDLCGKDPAKLTPKLQEVAKTQEGVQAGVVTSSWVLWVALGELAPGFVKQHPPQALAGHSVGLYSAMLAGEMGDFGTVLSLVKKRANLMSKAPAGGMIAVLGADPASIYQICQDSGTEIGAFNSPGNTVITGGEKSLKRARTVIGDQFKTSELAVGGPNHSRYLRRAGRGLRFALMNVQLADSQVPIYLNTRPEAITAATFLKRELRRHISRAVYWQQGVEAMLVDGIDTFIEVGPGETLAGLVKRTAREKNIKPNIINIKSLEAIQRLAG